MVFIKRCRQGVGGRVILWVSERQPCLVDLVGAGDFSYLSLCASRGLCGLGYVHCEDCGGCLGRSSAFVGSIDYGEGVTGGIVALLSYLF